MKLEICLLSSYSRVKQLRAYFDLRVEDFIQLFLDFARDDKSINDLSDAELTDRIERRSQTDHVRARIPNVCVSCRGGHTGDCSTE